MVLVKDKRLKWASLLLAGAISGVALAGQFPLNAELKGASVQALRAPLAEKFVSPEAAAQRLYDAWRRRNRRAALKVATRRAVNALFGNSWKSWGPMKFKSCEGSESGAIICRFISKRSGVLEMSVEGGASVGGYNVESVSLFSAID
jgi:hypothetical protein